MTSKNCTKKHDARAELLFCQSKPLCFCRSRWSRHRHCLSSLLVKQWLPAQGPVKVEFQPVHGLETATWDKWNGDRYMNLGWNCDSYRKITNTIVKYRQRHGLLRFIDMWNDRFWNSDGGHTYPAKRAFSMNNLWGLYMQSNLSHYSEERKLLIYYQKLFLFIENVLSKRRKKRKVSW